MISISIYLLWRAFVGLLILNDTYIKHPFKEDSYVGRINIDEINKKLKKIGTKENISEILSGFTYEEGKGGIEIYNVKAWDYSSLVAIIQKLIQNCQYF